ncbi:MAG: ABC transporter substrate-binding protein [Dongiaceae bacterium]
MTTAGQKAGITGSALRMKTAFRNTRGLMVAGLTAIGLTAALPVQAADGLTIVSWGGAYSESQREAFYKPFSKDTGIAITEEEYNGEIAKIRAMVEAGNITWDVVDLDTQTALAACAEGIIEVMDWQKLGLDRSKFIGGDIQDCAVPNIVYATVLAYDKDKLTNGPTKMADIFDLEKFPGKRSLQKNPYLNLEWALLADGVEPSKVYELLATEEGVDRALKKLDTIKSEVVWWEAGAQPPQLLADGEVVMATGWNGRFYGAVKNEGKNFVIVWDQQGLDWDWWGIPKGNPRLDTAMQFISYASQPDKMADQTKYISYGPANKDAVPNINKDVLADLPTAPGNIEQALAVDPQFWADHGEELRERFAAWLAQ